MTVVVFWLLAVPAVAAGLLVFRLASMARVTYALLAVFLFVGGLLIALGLAYLGVVVILMMVIEMVIMAVFMVAYMMNPAGLMPMSMVHNQRGALAISIATFVALAAGILTVRWPRRTGGPPPDPTLQVGTTLMSGQMLPMVTLGVALLATIVAATVLATQRGRYDRFGDDLRRTTPDDPIRGGVGR
jgi:NADH:ubiquinone oxidoreductase subunit 6 (subunit J)